MQFDGDNWQIIAARHVSFDMEKDRKCIYNFRINCCLLVTNYKYGNGAKLWGYVQQI